MATLAQGSLEPSRVLEKKLNAAAADAVVPNTQITQLLDQIRIICTTSILHDIASAAEQKAEDRIWIAHQVVNNVFRKALAELRISGKAKIVEKRKAYSEYLKFIKTSQRNYRDFIKDLATTYNGIPELERVAQKLNRESINIGADTKISPSVRALVLQSCHRTLIQLGDLSRYRETELNEKEKDWAPAIGYYDLAGMISPSNGTSHNQLAIIALADSNLYRATYHLYRALSATEPHPQALGNLRKAFFKINAAWDAGTLVRVQSNVGNRGSSPVIGLYLRLISMCFRGKSFSEHDEIENEVMTQLKIAILKNSFESTLLKLVLTNMAAGQFAQEQFQTNTEIEEHMQAYLFFLRLNIQTFVALLDIFLEELNEMTSGQVQALNKVKSLPVMILPNRVHTILPALRLYSLWLAKNVAVMTNAVDSTIDALTRKFWNRYSKCLSLLSQICPVESLSSVGYMLEEEAATIGFVPLHSDETREAWYNSKGLKSLSQGDPNLEHRIVVEMSSRIRSFVLTGLEISLNDTTPFTFDIIKRLFIIKGAAGDIESSPKFDNAINSSNDQEEVNPRAIHNIEQKLTDSRGEPSKAPLLAEKHDEDDGEAERMVENLVGGPLVDSFDPSMSIETLPDRNDPVTPDEHSFLNPSNIKTAQFPTGTHTAVELLNAVQSFSQQLRKSTSPKVTQSIAPRGSQPQSPSVVQSIIYQTQQTRPTVASPPGSTMRASLSSSSQPRLRPVSSFRLSSPVQQQSPYTPTNQVHSRMSSNEHSNYHVHSRGPSATSRPTASPSSPMLGFSSTRTPYLGNGAFAGDAGVWKEPSLLGGSAIGHATSPWNQHYSAPDPLPSEPISYVPSSVLARSPRIGAPATNSSLYGGAPSFTANYSYTKHQDMGSPP